MSCEVFLFCRWGVDLELEFCVLQILDLWFGSVMIMEVLNETLSAIIDQPTKHVLSKASYMQSI